MQKTARAAGIDDELRADRERFPGTFPGQLAPGVGKTRPVEFDLVKKLGAELLGLAHQELIEVRSVPVGIRHAVVRTRGHQQLVVAVRRGLPRLAEGVMVEREAALQPASHFRMRRLPGSPFCQGSDLREMVAPGEFLKKQIGQRS